MTEEKQEDIEVEVIAKIHTSGDRCGGRCALKGLEDLSEWHTCPLSRPFPDTPLETVVDYEPADALARSAWGDDIEYYRNDECFDAERAAKNLRAELVAEKERAAFHLALIERAEVLLRRVTIADNGAFFKAWKEQDVEDKGDKQ